MLPSRSRLKRDSDFSRVMGAGRKELFGPLLVFTTPGEATTVRFGVVVSKKVSKKAVERNKIRRQLAELLRPVAASLATPLDVVFLVLRPTEFREYAGNI